MSNVVIKVENLSKQYRLGTVGTGTLSHDLNRLWAKVRGKEDPYLKFGESNDRTKKSESEYVWALKNINFEVREGEILGIIGRNGAGKSTLLKILSQITRPTTGSVKMKGRIGSLLEVGTGFHPDLTGRENIYINGSILGMRKWEIDRKIDEIIDFAGVEKYIDSPVKRYSSGMMVRLGFSVAAHLEPEIMIVDEVLAVGDVEFQKKCIGKMEESSQKNGRTVLFVSHNMGAVESLCSRGIVLDEGQLTVDANSIATAIKYYFKTDFLNYNSSWEQKDLSLNNKYFAAKAIRLVRDTGQVVSSFISNNENVFVEIEGFVEQTDPALTIGYCLYNDKDQPLYWSYPTDVSEVDWPHLKPGLNILRSKLPARLLNEGDYRLELIGGLHFKEWLYEPGKSPQIFFTIQGGLSDSPYFYSKRPTILSPIIKWEVLDV